MPRNKSALIALVLKKAGIDITDPLYADLVNITGEIGDEAYINVEGGLNSLLNLEEAKNSSKLKQHFTALTLSPLDQEHEAWLTELGLSDADKAELLGDRSTYSRNKKILQKTRELEAAKATSSGSDAAKDRIAKLTKDLETLTNERKAEVDKIHADYSKKIEDLAYSNLLAGKSYANDKTNVQNNIALARQIINSELATVGAKAVFNNETNSFDLVHASDATLPYQDANHKNVNISDFIDGTLSKNGVLKINGDAEPQQSNTQPTILIPSNQKTAPKANAVAIDIINSKLEGTGFAKVS